MTFSHQARQEAAVLLQENECCFLAELSAIIRCTSQIKLINGKFGILISTEIPELYEKVNAILERLYGFSVELELADDESFIHNVRYEIFIEPEHAEQILTDTGITSFDSEHRVIFNDGIDKYVTGDACCKKAYIRGAFIGCSTNNIVLSAINNQNTRNSSGYHLEFVFSSEKLASDFLELLAQFELLAKKIKRKGSFIVYIKEAETISDLLATIGLNKAVMDLQNEITLRSLRNNINRQNNCLTGNITKTVNASIRQIRAINVIKETIGLENLTPELQQTAMLRLANEDESLDRLVKLSPKPISKSGLSHRLKKLISIAEDLQD